MKNEDLIFEYSQVNTYHLLGRIPAKKDSQQIFKTKKGKPFITSSNDHKKWEPTAILLLKGQKNHETIVECKAVVIKLIYGDLGVKDNTNTADSIHDAMVKAKIIKDDSWRITGTTIQIPVYEKGRYGAEIMLYS